MLLLGFAGPIFALPKININAHAQCRPRTKYHETWTLTSCSWLGTINTKRLLSVSDSCLLSLDFLLTKLLCFKLDSLETKIHHALISSTPNSIVARSHSYLIAFFKYFFRSVGPIFCSEDPSNNKLNWSGLTSMKSAIHRFKDSRSSKPVMANHNASTIGILLHMGLLIYPVPPGSSTSLASS